MSKIIKVKAKAVRKVYGEGAFWIWGMSPVGEFDPSLKIHPVYHNFQIKGDLGFITEGKEYTLELEEGTDRYGTFYTVISCDMGETYDLDNLTKEKSLEIMNEITTPAQAKYCIDAYEDFIKIALTQGVEGFDLKKIHNVGECRINAYVRELNTKFKYLDVVNKFKQWKLDITEAKTLCEEYKEQGKIKKELENNPYHVLIDVLNRSFEKADDIIIENRPDLEISDIRCAYLVASVIKLGEQEGDSKINANAVYGYMMQYIPKALPLENLIVPVVKENPLFHYNDEDKTVALTSTYNAEYEIATFFKNLVDNSTKLDIDYTKYTEIKDGTLTDEQQGILKHFCEYNLTIVNSRGGCGKSASAMALMDLMDDNGISYMTLCPTGKVAKRLRELTGRPASTIHKAVLSHQKDGGIWADCVLLEEGSMIGIDLMLMFIHAMANPNVRIVINLDLGQIAPISCGCPMRDIIYSNIIDTCVLSKCFRYGEGGLAKMATDAYDMKFYIKDVMGQNRATVGKNNDYTYVKSDGTVEQIINEYDRFLKRGIKPEDICVITCWNVTEFGTINLNNLIQKKVNPRLNKDKTVSRKYKGYEINFKVGDIILNTENNYQIMTLDGYNNLKSDNGLTKDDVPMGTCMNGELGKIIDIDDENIIAQFDEDILVFDKGNRNKLLLGYSLNSYKMQGSEIPYAITVVLPQFQKSLSKNMIYTDMSRAKKELVEIVDDDTVANSITIDTIADRQTSMQDIFKEICA